MPTNPVSSNPTPPESSFKPIDDDEPSKLDPSLLVPSAADEEKPSVLSGETSLNAQRQNLKRNRTAYKEDDVHPSKRQVYLPATPSDSPFQTLRVTKSGIINNRIPNFKTEDTSSCDDASRAQSTSIRPLGPTTMEQLTPYPTREFRESRYQLNQNVKVEPMNGFDVETNSPSTYNQFLLPTPTASTTRVIGFTQDPSPSNLFGIPFEQSSDFADMLVSRDADAINSPEDEYPLDDDLVDEDMTLLLGMALDNIQETHIPPSSVTKAWDHDSRSAAEYDPTLQHSSPPSSSEALKGSQAVGAIAKLGVGQDDLLDEDNDDVDWNTVYDLVDKIPKVVSTNGSRNTQESFPADRTPRAENTIHRGPLIEDIIPSKPFSRPSFPEKVRDRPVVTGLSSNAMLRTCFRMGEMINQAVRCLTHGQEVVFELFARVTYSSRESLAKTQHFQFVDLFKDQQPYPGGTLTNWRAGGQLDRQSMAFLDKGKKRKVCRCLCKPRRDSKTEVGFTLIILAIREADWTQVEWAKKVVCGDSKSDEQHGHTVDANT
ncbi:hypothetical protein F4820DRAFT_401485 [Hypoxylon rubiginosum]|uniref:Uncharacterized protein n=1 Tax=Hypoxylon rubiginosum TaxID=110542 RepID=A0ACB9ZHV5_9PEZI|nr:hypothetical protein F4820DRAFT_401485 [Hypoxylon rubiginosum]